RSWAGGGRGGRRSGSRLRQRSGYGAPRQTSLFYRNRCLASPGYPAWRAATPDNTGMGDRLTEYRRKRDPGRTPEPVPEQAPEPKHGDIYVIQQHHARRLHWDLRLERDGVLVSWALPRGLPRDPARNHLAVRTEDHPMEYADFAGDIPAGEYGAGRMVIYDKGRYSTQKWRDDEVIVV